jgi:tetratricopeptide (TPR) repeat protein
LKDSQSWYVLGNAHMTNYFTNNEDIRQLEHALKAYAQTEKNMSEPNPDLFFNRATIHEYLERYAEAIRDYNAAFVIDPSLQSDKLAGRIIDFVCRTFNAVQSRMGSSNKRQTEMVKSIPSKIEGLLKFPAH